VTDLENVDNYPAYQTLGLHAIIALDDNTHMDWVFSFGYFEKDVVEFVIETETTDRLTQYGAIIRPGYGGWLKTNNGVPVIPVPMKRPSWEKQVALYLMSD
jgi:hypothetical protein